MALPPVRPLLTRLLAGLLVALLVLGGVEAGLRLALGPPPAPLRVYGALGEKGGLERVADGWQATWQEGVPAVLPAGPRTEGPPRVYVLGGSSVHGGSDISPDLEFPAVLGHRTGALTWNLATPGLDTHDLVRIMEEVEAASPPQVWVVYAGHNDLGNARFQQRYGSVTAGLRAHTQAALEHLAIYATLSRMLRPQGARRQKGVDPGSLPPLTEPQVQTALRHLDANLEHMAWTAEQHGQVLVFVVPTCDLLWPPSAQPCAADRPCPQEDHDRALAIMGDDPAEASRLLVRARDHDRVSLRAPTSVGTSMRRLAAGSTRVRVVEAERDLPRHGDLEVPGQRLFIDGLHLSVAGHRALAELVAPVVAEALDDQGLR